LKKVFRVEIHAGGGESTAGLIRRDLTARKKNSISGRLFKNDEIQAAQILRNEAYNQYAVMTKDEASRQRRESRWRFSTAC